MTELAGSSHIAPDDGLEKPDSVGPPVPGVQCRVLDTATGEDAEPGRPGELLVRAPSVMLGYADGPSDPIDADGWLHTGDIVTVDEDGWYRVTDRIKELIKYKGFQVAPAELEHLLLTHPAVADAAVVRSPDDEVGEVPMAFVVASGPLSAEGLMGWVAERVAPYKRVRRVEFVSSIPRSAAGKTLRRLLLAPLAAEAAGGPSSAAAAPR
jgi:acyl-CoA synthetase (AMP-forming)/AMP-acid ligase II